MLIVCTLHERQGSDDLVARSAFTTCFRANIAYEVMNHKPPTDLRVRYLGIFGAYQVSRVVLHRHLPIYTRQASRHQALQSNDCANNLGTSQFHNAAQAQY